MRVVLAEKPSVAKEIAKVLGATQTKDGYLEGNGWIVTWAFGHLVGLCDSEVYLNEEQKIKYLTEKGKVRWTYDIFPIIPNSVNDFKYELKGDTSAKKQANVIKALFKDAEEIICATDAGREGEAIFRYIYNWAKSNKPVKRLWISSLTETAIQEGFAKLHDSSEFDDIARSAKARAIADWVMGVNATVGFSINNNKITNVGRVKSPTLAFIVERYLNNRDFVPTPYYTLQLTLKSESGVEFKAHYPTKFNTKEEAQQVLNMVKETIFLEDKDTKEVTEKAPLPYSLTALQQATNKKFNLSAQQTLDCIQKMYEEKFLTYPRTDSRYLATDMIPEISSKIQLLQSVFSGNQDKSFEIFKEKGIQKACFDNTKLTDHHAIIPTFSNLDKLNSLDSTSRKVYDLIATQLIMSLLPPAKKNILTYSFMFHDTMEYFKASGSTYTDLGWRIAQSYKGDKENDDEENQVLPNLQAKTHVLVASKELQDKMTQKPPLLTEATLLKLMETAGSVIEEKELQKAMKDCGIGTPATRAGIIESLKGGNFIEVQNKKYLVPTENGLYIYNQIKNYNFSSPKLTGEWELKLNQMADGDYDISKFYEEIKAFTIGIMKELKEQYTPNSTTSTDRVKLLHANFSCPICGSPIIETKYGICCKNILAQKCSFSIPYNFLGHTLTEEECVALLTGKHQIDKPLELTKKDGSMFTAKVRYNTVSKKIELYNDDSELIEIAKCPFCGDSVYSYEKIYRCKNKDFFVFKSRSKHEFTDEEIRLLCEQKKLEKVKFFIKKKDSNEEEEVLLNVEVEKNPKNDRSDYLVFKNPNVQTIEHTEICKCPFCGDSVYKANVVYRCTKGDFKVFVNKNGHILTDEEIKILCKDKKIENLMFVKKDGSGTYSAGLSISKEAPFGDNVTMYFPNTKQ